MHYLDLVRETKVRSHMNIDETKFAFTVNYWRKFEFQLDIVVRKIWKTLLTNTGFNFCQKKGKISLYNISR